MRIGVCENDPYVREQVLEWIEEYAGQELLETAAFGDGEAMLADEEGFDLVFLDIELGEGINGLAVAEALQARERKVLTVFLSGYASYISDVFYLNTFQFLLKPISRERFRVELERCFMQYHKDHQQYMISSNGERIAVSIGQILYIQVNGRKLEIYEKGRLLPYETYGQLNAAEKELAGLGFVRISRNCLINVRYVFGSAGETVRLAYMDRKGRQEIELPVSRRLRKNLQENIRYYLLEGENVDGR